MYVKMLTIVLVTVTLSCAALQRPEPEIPESHTTELEKSQRIAKLIDTIQDDTATMHADSTLSMHELTKIGIPAIPALTILLTSDNYEKWYLAQITLTQIAMVQFEMLDKNTLQQNHQSYEINSVKMHGLLNSIGYINSETTDTQREQIRINWLKWYSSLQP